MDRVQRRAYLREWRKRHPHYQRDWMRAKRKTLPRWSLKGTTAILGVKVYTNLVGKVVNNGLV